MGGVKVCLAPINDYKNLGLVQPSPNEPTLKWINPMGSGDQAATMEKVGVGPAAMRKGVVPLDKLGQYHHLYVLLGKKVGYIYILFFKTLPLSY